MANDLLLELFTFLKGRSFVTANEDTIKQLTLNTKHSPLTLYHRVVMQMTLQDYQKLRNLLERIEAEFNQNA